MEEVGNGVRKEIAILHVVTKLKVVKTSFLLHDWWVYFMRKA